MLGHHQGDGLAHAAVLGKIAKLETSRIEGPAHGVQVLAGIDADRSEIVRWLKTLPAPPKRLFLVHGEPAPMDALKATIKQQLGWDAATPQHLEHVAL